MSGDARKAEKAYLIALKAAGLNMAAEVPDGGMKDHAMIAKESCRLPAPRTQNRDWHEGRTRISGRGRLYPLQGQESGHGSCGRPGPGYRPK